MLSILTSNMSFICKSRLPNNMAASGNNKYVVTSNKELKSLTKMMQLNILLEEKKPNLILNPPGVGQPIV